MAVGKRLYGMVTDTAEKHASLERESEGTQGRPTPYP